MSMEEMLVKLFEQSPALGFVAAVAYLFWRALERINTRADEKAESLFKRCHEAHKENAEKFTAVAEKLTERSELIAEKSAQMGSQLHNVLGQVGVHLQRCAESSERLERSKVAH